LWAMVLSLWLWPLHPYQPMREAVAACYQAISMFIRVTVQAGAGQATEGSRWTASPIPERAAVVSAIEHARNMVVAARSARAGMSPVGQGLLVQVRRADALFDAIIALAEVREAASQHAGENQLGAEVDRVVPELIGSTKALAVAVAQQQGHLDLGVLDQAMTAVSHKVLVLTQSSPPHTTDDTTRIDLQSIAGALQRAVARVHAAADSLMQHGARHTVAPPLMLGSPSMPARVHAVVHLLMNHFTLQSLAFRHALRIGLTTTAAVALYTGLDLPHGAWVTLTVVAILKPNFGGAYQQAIQHVSGTVAGSIVGAILAAAVIKLFFLDLLLMPLGVLAFSIMAWHYGLGVLFLTSFVLVLLNTVQPGHWDFAVIRSLDTMIGGLLALLAGYLLWPSWERQRLPAQLARTITANLAYFRIVMSGYLGQPAERATLQAQRAQAQVENTNAAAAFQRLLSEPIIQHGPVAPAYSLVTYNQRLYDSITSLAVAQALGHGQRLLPGVDMFSTQVERALQELAQALRSGVRPSALPSFDASLSALHAHIRELVSEEMMTAPVEHSDQRHSRVIQDLAVLSSALDRLADEVIEMSKAVEQVEDHGTRAVQGRAFSHSSA